ncbi:MAG TPA: MMPL family transporter [Polyangiaceae bacterium]|nr:MMPL family transporter [Polyangiaceae bacterium]
MTAPAGRVERAVGWLIRRRFIVLAVATVLAVVAGYRTVVTYANLRSDLEELLPESAPSVSALGELRDRLPGLRHLGIVIDTGGAHNVDAANRFVDALAERIATYPPELVTAVRKDIAAERAFAETYGLQLVEPEDIRRLRLAAEERRDRAVSAALGTDLLEEDEAPPAPLPLEDLRRKYEQRFGAAGASFPGDRFVAKDGSTVVLLVQASSHATSYEADSALLSRVADDVQALGFPAAYAAEMRLGYAGDVATRVEEMEGLAADLTLSGGLVLLLVVAVIVGYFRSFVSLWLLSVPLAFGTVWAFGLAALPPFSIRHLNSNTAFLGSIIIGNGVNTGIILLARFREEQRKSADVSANIVRALSGTWRPTLAAASAASVAYGSLIFTDFRGFNQFGWIGGLGMLVCWVATVVLMPPLLSLFGARVTASQEEPGELGRWQRAVGQLFARPALVVGLTSIALLVSMVAVLGRSTEWIEHDFSKLRRRDSWESGERYWGARMDATLGRYLTPTVILAPDAAAARRIEERVRQLEAEDRAGGLIGQVRSGATVFPETAPAALAEAKQLARVLTPKIRSELSEDERRVVDRALSGEALQPLTAAALPDVLVAGLREHDGRIDRNVLVFPKLSKHTWDGERMLAFTRDLRAAAEVDGAQAPVAGSLLLASDIASAMKADGPRATALSLIAVLVICVAAFRSLKLSLLALLSLFMGVLLMLGGMSLSGERLNFSNFVALPITFGIGADYAINMLKRFQLEAGEANDSAGMTAALANTSGAVALCSATTIIGFGSLLIAQNRALFSFGVLAVAGEIACLLTAVVLLPALMGRLRRQRQVAPASAY